MITFETQEDFEAAVLRIIRDNLHLEVDCSKDFYSRDEDFRITLNSLDPDSGDGINLGCGGVTIPYSQGR